MYSRAINFLLLSVLFSPLTVFSQAGLPGEHFDCAYIKADTSPNSAIRRLPFSRINVIDCRFDTTKLGYLYSSSEDERTAVCMQTSVEGYVGSFLNRHYSDPSSGNDKIFACIRKFGIVDTGVYTVAYIFNLKVEYCLNRQSCFYPLYRFDSTSALEGEPESWAPSLNKMIMASTRKLYQIDRIDIQKLACYSARQIDSFNFAPRNIPVLRDQYLRKGVYLSFGQFKRNKPAYLNFGLSSDRKTDMIYVKGKNIPDSAIHDAWGFCDGERLFIRYGRHFYPLIRSGDNFEFFAETITIDPPLFNDIPATNYSTPLEAGVDLGAKKLLSKIRTTSKETDLCVLDMETGRIIRR